MEGHQKEHGGPLEYVGMVCQMLEKPDNTLSLNGGPFKRSVNNTRLRQ